MERNLLFLRYDDLYPVHCDVDALIAGFEALIHIQLPVQQFGLMGTGERGELPYERLAFLRRDEPGRLNGVNQQLQFGSFKMAGGYIIAVLDAPVMYDVYSKLNKLVDVLAQGAGIRFWDAAVLQVCGDVREGDRMLLIGVFPQVFENQQNPALKHHANHSAIIPSFPFLSTRL